MNSELQPDNTTAAAVTNSTDLTAAVGGEDWLNDPRIAYNQQTQKWIFEDPDNGKEYEYDSELGQWIDTTNVSADDNDKRKQNKNDSDTEETKKRKLQEEADLAELADQVGADSTTASKTGTNSNNSNRQKNKRAKHDQTKETSASKKPKQNKAIYISGLPKNVSAQELDQVFSKYGIIADDLNAVSEKKDNDYTSKRIKIYRDKQTGEPKGDALIVYFKPESVQLAIEMIDGSELRAGSGEFIKVQPAEFNNDNSSSNNSSAAEKSSTLDAPALNEQKKHRLQKHYEKLNHKLADWGDDDNLAGSSTTNKRWEKTVILKNVFTAAELAEDPLAASEIREDIIAGCEEGAGPVSSVVLFEHDPAGVVSVKFEDRDDALRCVELMNGRFFAGHRLTAKIYDGRERFQRKKKDTDDTTGTDEGKRLEEFGNWLEKEG
jgi:HIV Tat-specific factor 1